MSDGARLTVINQIPDREMSAARCGGDKRMRLAIRRSPSLTEFD
jgi:hypothetical protein